MPILSLNRCSSIRHCHFCLPKPKPLGVGLLFTGIGVGIAVTSSVTVVSAGMMLTGAILLISVIFKRIFYSKSIDLSPPEYTLKSLTERYPDLSFEAFQKMDEKERRELKGAFNLAFLTDFTHNAREPFEDFWIKSVFEFSENIFKDLLTKNRENSRIYALGQTPAWPIEIGRLLHPRLQLNHIAFSGNWWHAPTPENRNVELIFHSMGKIQKGQRRLREKEIISPTMRLLPNRTKIPSQEQILEKRKYFSSIGLDPRTIISSKNPTVIVDYVQSAAGLKSLVEFLKDWARELGIESQLQGKLQLHFLCSDHDSATFGGYPQFLQYLSTNFPNFICTSTFYTTATRVLAALSSKEESDQASHRLVAKSPTTSWTTQKETYDIENLRNIKLILFQIYKNFLLLKK